MSRTLSDLVEQWCARRELPPLADILPAWLANNGLTDGWMELAAACHHAAGNHAIPDQKRGELKRLWVEIDSTIR